MYVSSAVPVMPAIFISFVVNCGPTHLCSVLFCSQLVSLLLQIPFINQQPESHKPRRIGSTGRGFSVHVWTNVEFQFDCFDSKDAPTKIVALTGSDFKVRTRSKH